MKMKLEKGNKAPKGITLYTIGERIDLAKARELVAGIEEIPDPETWEEGEAYVYSDDGRQVLEKVAGLRFQRLLVP